MKKDTKQRLFEIMSIVDKSFKAKLNEYDNYSYPAGADSDPKAPWNQDDEEPYEYEPEYEHDDDIDESNIMVESNIYNNKYGIQTIEKPIIPDAVTILSKNPNAVKFTDKNSFDRFASQQKYFSASHSHCFYTPKEYDDFSRTGSQYNDPDSQQSKMVFETGHELVQVWDNKNNVGYVIPNDKTDGKMEENNDVDIRDNVADKPTEKYKPIGLADFKKNLINFNENKK